MVLIKHFLANFIAVSVLLLNEPTWRRGCIKAEESALRPEVSHKNYFTQLWDLNISHPTALPNGHVTPLD